MDCRIIIPKGDNRTLKFTIVNEDTGAPIDLTSGSAVFYVGTTEGGNDILDYSTSEASEMVITDDEGGELEVYIVPASTSSLDPSLYHYKLIVTLASGKVYTTNKGIFEVEA